MSDENIAMPGDPDSYKDKILEQQKDEKTPSGSPRKKGARPSLEEEAKRKDEQHEGSVTGERGPLSPSQFEDDGWGDTPVQMRGE